MIHFFYVWLGLSNASGAPYLFWSGFFGDITIFGGLVALYKHRECHIAGCHRPGKFPFQHYKLCKKHSPHVPKELTHLHIAKLYKSAKLKK